jgi:hypothetical protein
VQVGVLLEGGLRICTVGTTASGTVALVHLDAVRIELVFLEGDRLADRLALRLGLRRAVVAARGQVLLHLFTGSIAFEQAERLAKIGPNSSIDRFARVTICFAMGARSTS